MKAKFINTRGDSIEFGSLGCSIPLILQKVDISTPVNLYSAKGMLQDGETYINNTLARTSIDIRAAVRVGSDLELRQAREKIREVFNPNLGLGTFYYKGRKIKAIVEEIPYFENNVVGHYQECVINLAGLGAYWEDETDLTIFVAKWKKSWTFPMVIPEKKKLVFGKRKKKSDVNIYNQGDKKAGMIAILRANGDVVDPYISNVHTKQRFQLDKTLVPGEEYIINSREGEKRIDMLNNPEGDKNGYRYMAEDSEFIELEIGDNIINYGAKEGASALEVEIIYNNKYLGV